MEVYQKCECSIIIFDASQLTICLLLHCLNVSVSQNRLELFLAEQVFTGVHHSV